MNRFKEGNIVRLSMRNFLTYNDIKVYPGSHLNIIFGANGTGKSSILCAICIVLGGKTELTGRGKDLRDYIKHGEEKATIEIELFSSKRNIVIKRKLTRTDKAKIYFQGRETSLKQVQEEVKKFGICIDNLCQFLPQDKVSEFSKLNKMQLLYSTQRAIGEADLADQHQILCQQGKDVDEVENQIATLLKQLVDEKGKNNMLLDQVEAIENEKDLNKLIKKLRSLRLLMEYNTNHRELKDVLEPSVKQMYKQIETLKKDIAPMKMKEEDIHNKMKSQRVLTKQLTSNTNKLEQSGNVYEEKILKCHMDIENEESQFQTYERYCSQMSKEIDDLKHTIEAMEGHLQLQDNVNEQEVHAEIKELTRKISTLSEKSSNLKSKINENAYTLVAENNKMVHIERSLKNLQDSKERRLKLLLQSRDTYERKNFKAVYDATGWLQQNADKFQGSIHGPMYTIIDAQHPIYAKYIENTVSKNDLIAFICECKDDVNLLKKYADNFHWPINIIHSDPSQSKEYYPAIPIERLREIGFQAYLKDVIIAPPAVISYLCSIYRIQNIALGEDADFSSVPDGLSCFFIDDDRYDKTVSKYDGASSTSISPINDVFFMSLTVNENDLRNVQNEKQVIMQRIEALQLNKCELVKCEENAEKELEGLRREKQQLQNKLHQKLQLITKIQERRNQLCRREAEDMDLEGTKLKMTSKVKNIIRDMLELADKLGSIREELADVTIKIMGTSLTLKAVTDEKENLEAAMEEFKSQILLAEDNYAIEKQKQVQMKSKLIGLVNTLCREIGCSVAELKENNSRVRDDLLNGYTDKSLEEIEQLLCDAEARKECLISPDGNVLDDFKNREELIKKLDAEIEKLSKEVKISQSNLEEAKSDWLPKMEELTHQINQHFSTFMRRLGCAGDVTLDKGSNDADFTKYGLSIKVQFRDTEKLKELTSYQQSGGEKSVSTALYLMALQTLTTVPFRCVDEINQGMDGTNEKRMFEMLVETSTAESASQYFFVTPKLLSDLPNNRKVKYLNIVNGPNVPHHKLMSGKNLLENLKRSMET